MCQFPVTCVFLCPCRFAGYDTGACKQPPPVVYTLKLLIGAAPVAFIVTGLMILLLYPISEDVRLRNKVCLDELRWVDKHLWNRFRPLGPMMSSKVFSN